LEYHNCGGRWERKRDGGGGETDTGRGRQIPEIELIGAEGGVQVRADGKKVK